MKHLIHSKHFGGKNLLSCAALSLLLSYRCQSAFLRPTGDGCRRDEDGYYWITGRVDDVMNVSGGMLAPSPILVW